MVMPSCCSVLLVEDDEGVQELLRYVLEHEGNSVTIVGNGPSMRSALEADSFEVAIINVGLPGPENGLPLAQLASDSGCGVVIITGDHRHRDTLEDSGHRYLLKPFRIEALLDVVERAIGARCVIRRAKRS